MLFLFGLLLKILKKLQLGHILYPLFYLINKHISNILLPNVIQSKECIKKNERIHKFVHNIYYYGPHPQNNHSNKYDVQIIIPVYNAERYIVSCINSILHQITNYRFQIIIINDGSIDRTTNILSRYKDNPLIIIINEKNCGRSFARNRGLNYVTSKYVMFVDADDKLAPNAIQDLLTKAYENYSDIVFGKYRIFYNNGHLSNSDSKAYYKDVNDISINSVNDVDSSVAGKVFKSNLFRKVHFPVGYEFEDMMLSFWIYPLCVKMSSIRPNVYFYRYNKSSITHKFQFTNISIDSYLILSLLIRNLHKYNIKVDQYIYNTFLEQVKMTCMRNIYISSNVQKSIFVMIHQLYNDYFTNFTTNISRYKPLENSIKNNDFLSYVLFCIMN